MSSNHYPTLPLSELPAAGGKTIPTELAKRPCQLDSAGTMESYELLRGHQAVTIHHQGLTYRLQATRLGKLLLTK